MNHEILDELMVFVGLMATLGCITKIILIAMTRRKPLLKESSVATLEEMGQRLARMEQSIDAAAVEIERISEAQRFTTKLLSEKVHQGLPDSSRAKVTTPH